MGLEVFDHYECDGQMEIEDIAPERRLTHLSLFSGIGGLDLAAEWAGFSSVGQCEYADYPTKILERHWPDVPRWRDIRTLTGADFYERTGLRTVDIISGGFPCQPFSTAGKQRGEEDDRYLWPEMVRVIAELRPTWVVGENVAGIINMALDKVLSDLEGQGYTTRTFLIPAAGVNAPHQRYRTAIVAHADRIGQFCGEPKIIGTERGKPPQPESGRCCEDVANPYRLRCSKQENWESDNNEKWDDTAQKQSRRTKLDEFMSSSKTVPYPNRPRFQTERTKQQTTRVAGNGYEVRNTTGQRLSYGTKRTMGEPGTKQEPKRPDSRRGEPDGTRQWAVEPNVGRVAHGIPNRVDRIKCLGNAVVPQQFYPIFRSISDIELETKTRI